MGFKKTKGNLEARRYVSRNKACKILQLGLPEFRKLCIYKGVYPRVPKSRLRAQKGDSSLRTLYLRRDITYLSHEPIIWKFRDQKIFRRKLNTKHGKNEKIEAGFYRVHKSPVFILDHIVLERYPTFDKALQDLDDALSTCFLYAILPNATGIDVELVHLCRKVTTEFLNYVIESQSLRKTFITIRGYFYRAHIQGEKVTWMIPHPFPPQGSSDVDIRIMKTFVDFYATLLGFVNFKLYQSLNVYYPPKLSLKAEDESTSAKEQEEEFISIVQSLSTPLKREFSDDVDDEDSYDNDKDILIRNDRKLRLAQAEREKVKNQMNLFKNKKFYLGRETNRESLTLVIRSGKGLVSWDRTAGPGATYAEDDPYICYQIIDRPFSGKRLSRYYIQPQWVYDSFNAGILLPVQNYFVGVDLPAHLSPFEETYHQTYVPPEMQRILALQNRINLEGDQNDEMVANASDEEVEDIIEEDEADDETLSDNSEGEAERETMGKGMEPEQEDGAVVLSKKAMKKKKKAERKKAAEESEDKLAIMSVTGGPSSAKPSFAPAEPNNLSDREKKLSRKQKYEDMKLASAFIHRKQKKLFKMILSKEKHHERYGKALQKKRIIYEQEMLARKKRNAEKAAERKSK